PAQRTDGRCRTHPYRLGFRPRRHDRPRVARLGLARRWPAVRELAGVVHGVVDAGGAEAAPARPGRGPGDPGRPGARGGGDGRPLLIDFGIARATSTRRRSGAPRGSAPFMAAEQCRDEAATPASDLFALGALLFEAATGEHAFHPRRLGGEWLYPQLAGIGPDPLPGALGELIARLLDAEPAGRPADATEVMWALAGTLPAGTRLWPEWLCPDL